MSSVVVPWKIDNSKAVAFGLRNKLSKYEGKIIYLLTLEELRTTKSETPDKVLISIFGESVFAKDADEDTRSGMVAYGVLSQ